jgi:hypothetical protein
MSYDFSSLSDYDFEILVRDLLSGRDSQRYESFKAGRDQGIDVRCLKAGTTIGQCKHWRGSGFAALLRHIKNEEAAKVLKLAPDRYLLITSVPLSKANKAALREALDPFVVSDDDIVGQEDVNALLREFPSIEQAHPKLWLTSAAVLDRLVNAAAYARMARKVEDVAQSARLYVQNRSFEDARKRLTDHRVCVIAGPPGIGKSMLADMLVLHHLADGYEAIVVSQDAADADELVKPDKRQILLYDDFLGRTNLVEHFNKNEDSRLSQLMHQIHRTPGKRLILTTREYILRDAQAQYDVVAGATLDPLKIVLDLNKYTRRERAQILYNHLYFSELPLASLRSVVETKAYHEIIRHANYSPRLVEHVTSMAVAAGREVNFGEFVLETFDNPSELWRRVFASIHRVDQSVLLALASFRGSTSLEVLYDAARAFSTAQHAKEPDRWTFDQALKRLEGTFIDINAYGEHDRQVDFRDPSVKDFLLHYLDGESTEFEALVEGAERFEQIQLLAGYGRANRQDGVPESVQYPGLASTIKRVSDRFAGRLLRIVAAENARDSPGGRERDLRVAACAAMSRQLNSDDLDSWIVSEMLERASEWEGEGGSRDAVVAVAAAAGFMSPNHQPVLDEVRAKARQVCTTLSDATSYRNLVALAESLPALLAAEDFQRAREEFDAFVDERVDYLADVDQPDELAESLDDLDYVAARLGVDISVRIYALQDRLSEMYPEDDEEPWEEREPAGPSSLQIETAEIESLFESLLEGPRE